MGSSTILGNKANFGALKMRRKNYQNKQERTAATYLWNENHDMRSPNRTEWYCLDRRKKKA